MKLDLNDSDVFDRWREQYHELTDEEHKDFADACEKKYPTQKHFNPQNFHKLFENREMSELEQMEVLEIGGWKGELALDCLSKYDLKSWTNVELCQAAVTKTVPGLRYKPYKVFCPKRFDWWVHEDRKYRYDVCVSAHTIEHLADVDLISLINYIAGIPVVMFEAPIGENESDWKGYLGTHILKMGWLKIDERMKNRSYAVTKINDTCRLYTL